MKLSNMVLGPRKQCWSLRLRRLCSTAREQGSNLRGCKTLYRLFYVKELIARICPRVSQRSCTISILSVMDKSYCISRISSVSCDEIKPESEKSDMGLSTM